MKCKHCKTETQNEFCDKCIAEINEIKRAIKFQKEKLVQMGVKVDVHNSSEFCREPKIFKIIFYPGKINKI